LGCRYSAAQQSLHFSEAPSQAGSGTRCVGAGRIRSNIDHCGSSAREAPHGARIDRARREHKNRFDACKVGVALRCQSTENGSELNLEIDSRGRIVKSCELRECNAVVAVIATLFGTGWVMPGLPTPNDRCIPTVHSFTNYVQSSIFYALLAINATSIR
jgi:hypothetical protein